jgi:hypothetical protein
MLYGKIAPVMSGPEVLPPALVRSSDSSPRRHDLSATRWVVGLLGIATAVLAAYIANSPRLDRFGDSPTYEFVADGLPRSFISSSRLPGYPILIALSSWLPGGREVGLICTQAALILVAVAVTYFIARAAVGRQWLAFAIGVVIATDLLMAGYVRVVMSETLAVTLTLLLLAATLRYMADFQPLYLWLMAGLTIALILTRPEWLLMMAILVPYLLVIARRRGVLTRRLVAHGIASTAIVLMAVGAYCAANLAVNGYFGLSSFTNVALLGKLMVYGMIPDAPAPYSSLVPMVESYPSAWELVRVPPFNDRNSALAGEFARAVIVHEPALFIQNVLGTAISSAGDHETNFLRIDANGPFGHWLGVLLAISQSRYRAFVILPALALAWAIAGVIVPVTNRRAQVMGVLGLFVFYDWLTTAAGTYGEFGRLRMPVNSIGTIIVIGTLFLVLLLGFRDRDKRIPAVALVVFELAWIGLLPHLTSIGLSEIALIGVALVTTVAIVRWSGPLMSVEGEESSG